MKKAIILVVLSLLIGGGLQAQVKEITTKDFTEQIFDYTVKGGTEIFLGTRPCIVDFYASWCAPCRALAPTLEQLAEKYKGAVDFYKVDVDKNKTLSTAYSIKSIPTLLFCKANGEVAVIKGAASQEKLEEAIKNFLLQK